MALNFPDNPTVGDSYTSGTHTWQWDGIAWTTVPGTAGLDNLSDVVITAPLAADQGIFYNGTNWVNTTHTHNINQLSGTLISDPITGQVLSYNGIYWTNMAPADAGFNPFLLMGA